MRFARIRYLYTDPAPGMMVEAPIGPHTQGVLPQNWGETEQNRTVTCMVLKAKANARRKILALRCNEFRGP
ncbi:hypothetical protein TNCV_945391 [Trichonephila clavipes]|nr:hypothetical protein TNCV_945391 [Trichonephila clavipes]